MKEKRRARRFPLDLEILAIQGKPAPAARLVDLSSNGARLKLPFSVRLKEQLNFQCLLPGLKKPIKLSGYVVWKKPAGPDGLFVLGVQFYQNYWELDQWLRQPPLVSGQKRE